MTLGLAWRSEGRIHLASDSRITLSENQTADIGIKVLSLPILVVDTQLDRDGNLRHLFQRRYGFCYAGSLINASTLKELLEELLQGVQYIGAPEKLSFAIICNTVADYCGHISTELCNYLFEKGAYEFFFTGFCPQKKCLQAAHFSLIHQDGHASATYKMILDVENSYVAIGKGATAANQAVHKVSMRHMLLTLNEIIDNQQVESVGGDIQYGTFDKNGHFSVSGIARISMESELINSVQYGPTILKRHKYRGFQLYVDFDPEINPLWVSPGFIDLDVPSNSESHDAFLKNL
jgi:hypothetical protein